MVKQTSGPAEPGNRTGASTMKTSKYYSKAQGWDINAAMMDRKEERYAALPQLVKDFQAGKALKMWPKMNRQPFPAASDYAKTAGYCAKIGWKKDAARHWRDALLLAGV